MQLIALYSLEHSDNVKIWNVFCVWAFCLSQLLAKARCFQGWWRILTTPFLAMTHLARICTWLDRKTKLQIENAASGDSNSRFLRFHVHTFQAVCRWSFFWRFSGFRRAVQGVARDVDVCKTSPVASDHGLSIETHTCVLKSKANFSSFCMSLNARYNDT